VLQNEQGEFKILDTGEEEAKTHTHGDPKPS